MPYEIKPINVIRKENTSTIDKMCGIKLAGPNKHITKPVNIDIPKPYFKHDVNKGKTYFVGKEKITKSGLCDVITKALNDADSADVFKDAVCIEFYKEDETDIAPKIRAMEFHAKVYAALTAFKDNPIEFSMGSWPTSHIDKYNSYPYAEYLIFQPNKEKGVTSLKIGIQK